MSKNSGKVFEDDFKKSIPDYCLLIRLPDPPQAFTQRSDTRFSNKNPFDFLMYDSNSRLLWTLELKSTKFKSISFEDVNIEEVQNKMIHKHQILGLMNCAKYDGVCSGFVYNFRDEKNNVERTYFQDINDFNKMVDKIGKKSLNELDLILDGNAVKINGVKRRVRYAWDIDGFLKSQDLYK